MTNDNTIRIGFCTDLSGPYQGVDGPAGAEAIRMAMADMGGAVAGRTVELVLGDHRNDPDEAAAIARRWYGEDAVDVIIDGVNSDTSLAMTAVAAEMGKLILIVGAGTSVQTRERASPSCIQYAYSTVALATVPALALTRQGLKRWFYMTADYPFGRELEEHSRAAVQAAGGTIVGSVTNPHGADDFTPFIQAALDSGADVLGLANGHADLIKAMAAMDTMGVRDRMRLVGLLTFIDDIHDLGLEEAQGLYVADSWFWTRDDESRTWAKRFFAAQGRMPSSLQAADYSAALQYLRAVEGAGSSDANVVVRQFKSMPLDDMYLNNASLRADGTLLHDMYMLRVKAPGTTADPWDVYDFVETVSGAEAFPE